MVTVTGQNHNFYSKIGQEITELQTTSHSESPHFPRGRMWRNVAEGSITLNLLLLSLIFFIKTKQIQ